MAENEDRLTEHRLHQLELAVGSLTKSDQDQERRLTVQETEAKAAHDREKEYVTRQEFTPIRMVVYGLAATALTGLLSAILSKLFAST